MLRLRPTIISVTLAEVEHLETRLQDHQKFASETGTICQRSNGRDMSDIPLLRPDLSSGLAWERISGKLKEESRSGTCTSVSSSGTISPSGETDGQIRDDEIMALLPPRPGRYTPQDAKSDSVHGTSRVLRSSE